MRGKKSKQKRKFNRNPVNNVVKETVFRNGIIVGENEPFEKAIKRFKKYVEQERILSTYAKKQYFISNTEKRKIKERRAFYRRLKMEKKLKNRFD